MPALVELNSVSYATPDGHLVLDRLDLVLGRECCGLVGRNGVGKSTLLKLVAGELAPSSGAVVRRAPIRWLRQDVDARPGDLVADALGVAEAWRCLRRIEAGEGTVEDLAEADWTLPARIDEALAEVGLSGIGADRPLAQLSGGQRTRAALASLRLDDAELLLLDEPSNNLDAQARGLLARLLAGRRGATLVASHDRALLRGVDRVIELSSNGVRSYGGGYDAYREQREREHLAAERGLADAERELQRVERERQLARERQQKRDARGRRDRARDDMPRILLGLRKDNAEDTAGGNDRLAARQREQALAARNEARQRVERHASLEAALPACGLAAGQRVLAFESIGFAWPGAAPLLQDLDFHLVGPERVALCGRNGAGKSTVLRLAAGLLEPTHGRILRGVPFALLDQHAALLDRDASVLDNFQRLNPDDGATACRTALARFRFRAGAALQRVATLSGGELLRAALACVLGGGAPPQLLLLDEPTNHLDLDSIAAIESALSSWDGALLVASHDEDFLDALGIERRIEPQARTEAT
ncbi:ABC-F family ATP-binding cassette domain-containing protein [Dokdonella sp.]|uniref:ABC-F family ATP-binding cassette domain-containing protein n=1 Tax=Dokdonella sp. TaxID=2291710 RepID=UPI0026158A9F|nr:ABC-F family ATP-binding cassette domain-containing protein [Dokdonella sp.]